MASNNIDPKNRPERSSAATFEAFQNPPDRDGGFYDGVTPREPPEDRLDSTRRGREKEIDPGRS